MNKYDELERLLTEFILDLTDTKKWLMIKRLAKKLGYKLPRLKKLKVDPQTWEKEYTKFYNSKLN